jgi:putative ABC transport system permease protein
MFILHDLRYAIRLLRNNPGLSAVAIATIALAIGANTAMFSFVNGVLLSPLPYPESNRIVRVLERHPIGGLNGISTLNYLDWTNQNAVFEYMAGEVSWRATLTGGDEPVWIRGARVSAHYFDIFGAKPALGRMFLPGEDQVGKDRVVLLSHSVFPVSWIRSLEDAATGSLTAALSSVATCETRHDNAPIPTHSSCARQRADMSRE